jgi:hypothetical protein
MRAAVLFPPSALPQDLVKQHFDTDLNRDSFKSLSARSVSFACVDSRSEEPLLGTPGGDMSEFMAAVGLYFNLTNTPFSQDVVDDLFNSYLAKGFGKSRKVGMVGQDRGRDSPRARLPLYARVPAYRLLSAVRACSPQPLAKLP